MICSREISKVATVNHTSRRPPRGIVIALQRLFRHSFLRHGNAAIVTVDYSPLSRNLLEDHCIGMGVNCYFVS